MTWFKVDDTLSFHPKIIAAGNAAMGLWVRAGSWAAQQGTDGFVPRAIAATLGTRTQATRLVDAGLWIRTPSGYRFHEWNDPDRQPTRAEIEAKRQAWREKKQAQRRGKTGKFEGEAVGMSPGDTPGTCPPLSPRDVSRMSPEGVPGGVPPFARAFPSRPVVPTSVGSHLKVVLPMDPNSTSVRSVTREAG